MRVPTQWWLFYCCCLSSGSPAPLQREVPTSPWLPLPDRVGLEGAPGARKSPIVHGQGGTGGTWCVLPVGPLACLLCGPRKPMSMKMQGGRSRRRTIGWRWSFSPSPGSLQLLA